MCALLFQFKCIWSGSSPPNMLDICDVSRIGLRDLSVYLLFLVQQVTLRKLFCQFIFVQLFWSFRSHQMIESR